MTGLQCLSWIIIACSSVLTDMSAFTFANDNGCPETNFIGCVTRIRLQRVPFDTNILNVVFNVTSEAKLRQTCIAYNEALPCFRDRILQCGNDKQKRLLEEVAKMIKFFCSSSSSETQQLFLKHAVCIGKVLQMPATTDCYSASHPDGKKLEMCRQHCKDKKEFLCMMKIWVSEQSLCTMIDAERRCGAEAAEFYQSLQINVFTDAFPILCDYAVTYDSTTSTWPNTAINENTVAASYYSNYSTTTIASPVKVTNVTVAFLESSASPIFTKMVTKVPLRSTVSPTATNQYRRIVEITVIPPPRVVHTVEESSTVIPQNRPFVFEMDHLQNANNQSRTFSVQNAFTTPSAVSKTQTFWRPWYLRGVNYNVETSTTTTTGVENFSKTTPTLTITSSKAVSISELFSYPWLKKPKYPENLEFTNEADVGGTTKIGLNRKENDYAPKLFRWSLWNSGSSCYSSRFCTAFIAAIILILLKIV